MIMVDQEVSPMETRTLTAQIPAELAEKVEELATALHRPEGSIVAEALSVWVQLEEVRHQLTLEGLADVDAGRVIDDAEIEAWIKGLETDPTLAAPTPKS
jgi:predicted transcriptional regulator